MTKQYLHFYKNHERINPIGYCRSSADLTIFSRLKLEIQMLFVFRLLSSNKSIVHKPG